MANKMTFHESYGELTTRNLRLIRKYNVSVADYDLMLERGYDQDEISIHILFNVPNGYYQPAIY